MARAQEARGRGGRVGVRGGRGQGQGRDQAQLDSSTMLLLGSENVHTGAEIGFFEEAVRKGGTLDTEGLEEELANTRFAMTAKERHSGIFAIIFFL